MEDKFFLVLNLVWWQTETVKSILIAEYYGKIRCFHGALEFANASSSSQSTFMGFEAKDKPGDPNVHLYSSPVCIRVTFW